MKISVLSQGQEENLQVSPGVRLLDYLRDARIYVNASCGGRGSCHKCRVQVKKGFLAQSSFDKKAFKTEELEEGWRLSCQALPRGPLSVVVPEQKNLKASPRIIHHADVPYDEVFWACDLGSTGIVVALGNEKGEAIAEAHLLNKQVLFGDDVMTRLHFAMQKGVGPLQETLLETLQSCKEALTKAFPDICAKAKSDEIFCAGNAAMTSFLHRWNIESLATAPFQPENLNSQHVLHGDTKFTSLPLLGGFVGGDTFAGILALKKLNVSTPWMLVDMGTNTEVVLNTGKKELYFASAPAGPAFEGGNISCGMRAEPGAVAHATFTDSTWDLDVLGKDLPQGICGSGLMDILVESVKAGLLQKDGYLDNPPLNITSKIYVTADDVREFQLAKSATRTACDILIDRAGVRPTQIYLAGSFAAHIKEESLLGIGLLPEGIPVRALGNLSLKGSLLYARMSEEERSKCVNSINEEKRAVELALQDDFQGAFVNNLNF